MIKISFLIISLFFSGYTVASDNYSIYLVRHAEKAEDSKNPTLTTCGKERAIQLASMLSQANIANIYSTSYHRTMQTAKPLANKEKVAIKNYNPNHLEQLALQLKRNQINTLVVGHSNTTPMLVELLIKQKVTALTEHDYQFLYQVQFTNNKPILTIFKQPLNCSAK